MRSKIVKLEDLADYRGVLAHGCFDLVHIGHLRYFKWAKQFCVFEPLIVTTPADEFFPQYKGSCRPAFPQDIRAEWLSHIELIDYVAIVNEPTGILAINTIKPIVYCKDWEAKGAIPDEVVAVQNYGGRVEYMEKECANGQIYSSGAILSGFYLKTRANK